jgi:type III pantothenate kinase
MLLLAVDIGNSSTKFGIFRSTTLLQRWHIPTQHQPAGPTPWPADLLTEISRDHPGIEAVAASSVVPGIEAPFSKAASSVLGIEPVLIDHSFDFGFAIDYDPPGSIGIDRLVNAAAAVAEYGAPVAVCSFGTATTIDAVDHELRFRGGTISPGIGTNRKTAKLPSVDVSKPASVFGRSTSQSISSGVFSTAVGGAREILMRIYHELGLKTVTVATGGFAGTISPELDIVDHIDADLTLKGIRWSFDRNHHGAARRSGK